MLLGVVCACVVTKGRKEEESTTMRTHGSSRAPVHSRGCNVHSDDVEPMLSVKLMAGHPTVAEATRMMCCERCKP